MKPKIILDFKKKTRKTGTNEFKINNIHNHKDFEEARRISNRNNQ